MIYLISIPDIVDPDFLNSFLLTFKFYAKPPQNLPNISPTPKIPLPNRSLPLTDLSSQWSIYESEKFGFSIAYPDKWRKKEMLSGTGNPFYILTLQGLEGDIEVVFLKILSLLDAYRDFMVSIDRKIGE